ncbi:MAG: tripartite tricarboxylate transporter TctB family protein [Chloroflexota bacterium]
MLWTNQARTQAVAASVLLLFGLFMLWQAFLLKVGTPNTPGPGFFPVILSVVLLLLSLGLVFQARENGAAITAPSGGATSMHYREIAAVLGLVLLLALIIEPVGYVIGSAIVTCALLKMAGRTWRASLIIGLLATVLSFFLFDYALGVPLPKGVLDGLL